MDARPARLAGKSSSDAGRLLETAVFATTDRPPQVIAGGSDDYHTPTATAAAASASRAKLPAAPPAGQVRWRPRETHRPAWHSVGRTSGSSDAPAVEPTMDARSGAFSPAEAAAPDSALAPRPSHESGEVACAAGPAWLAVSRGVAGFLGVFMLLNVVAEMRHAGFDANLGWIDLRPFPAAAVRAWLMTAGVLLLAFAARPLRSPAWRGVAIVFVGLLLAVALWNTLAYYGLLRRGHLHGGPAVPFSLHVAVCLVVILAGLRQAPLESERRGRHRWIAAGAFVACCVGFPLAQIHCAGRADYRRAADAAVVVGCQVHADGTPSEALVDRVDTACRLYREGLVKRIVLSGGPGEGRVSEVEAMRRLVLAQGVPAEALEMDAPGRDTVASVRNTAKLLQERSAACVLVVSHFYDLPRIRLSYRRAGIEVFTVPAEQTQPLARQAWRSLGEAAALWWHYLRPLASA
jgi:uncharacterized SAM-binding protein YcdF (DUF218 family)